LIADGIESMLDIISSMVVLGGVRYSLPSRLTNGAPEGHGKAEPLAALAVATTLLGASIAIAIQSVREILGHSSLPEPFTLVVLVVVVAFFKEFDVPEIVPDRGSDPQRGSPVGCVASSLRCPDLDRRFHWNWHRIAGGRRL